MEEVEEEVKNGRTFEVATCGGAAGVADEDDRLGASNATLIGSAVRRRAVHLPIDAR